VCSSDLRLDLVSAGAARVCDRFSTAVERCGERLGRIIELRIGENEAALERSLKSVSMGVKMFIERNESILASSASALDALSPLAVLGRGYSICKKQDGTVIKSASQLSIGDAVSLVFKDGTAQAGITGVMAESDSPRGQA
jgi:exodeoxyribonuclease VII large subunit